MNKYPQGKYERHPLSVPGPFYVEDEPCVSCFGPKEQAPELIGFFEGPPGARGCGHCYVKRQPVTPEDVEAMVQAMAASFCSGLRYCGDDPAVLERLKQHGQASRCDALSDDPGGSSKPAASCSGGSPSDSPTRA